MSRSLIIRPEAEADMTEAALWYEQREAGLGMELIEEIRAAIRRGVEGLPSYPCLRRRPNVRRVLVKKFPCRVFFTLRDAVWVVFGVLHAARLDRHGRSRA
jgi:toxin ParE1/3/4